MRRSQCDGTQSDARNGAGLLRRRRRRRQRASDRSETNRRLEPAPPAAPLFESSQRKREREPSAAAAHRFMAEQARTQTFARPKEASERALGRPNAKQTQRAARPIRAAGQHLPPRAQFCRRSAAPPLRCGPLWAAEWARQSGPQRRADWLAGWLARSIWAAVAGSRCAR